METLLDNVSDAAYDKAVEVVTDTVRQETHKEDIRLIEETKKWVLSPERKAPQKERDYAAARLDGVVTKIKRVMQNALAKIQNALMQPEVKNCLLYTSLPVSDEHFLFLVLPMRLKTSEN